VMEKTFQSTNEPSSVGLEARTFFGKDININSVRINIFISLLYFIHLQKESYASYKFLITFF